MKSRVLAFGVFLLSRVENKKYKTTYDYIINCVLGVLSHSAVSNNLQPHGL